VIHVVFNRPSGKLKIYASDKSLWGELDAGGDAWGDGSPADGPYGHLWPCPPGHYVLEAPQNIAPPSAAEGAWQMPVADLSSAVAERLVDAHDATRDGSNLTIGGLAQPIGQLAKFSRSAIMIHGGGSNDPDPLADYQPLCKTDGCTRLHNADLARVVAFLSPLFAGNTVVYTIVGDPLPLSC
jgi:hypothetical protein